MIGRKQTRRCVMFKASRRIVGMTLVGILALWPLAASAKDDRAASQPKWHGRGHDHHMRRSPQASQAAPTTQPKIDAPTPKRSGPTPQAVALPPPVASPSIRRPNMAQPAPKASDAAVQAPSRTGTLPTPSTTPTPSATNGVAAVKEAAPSPAGRPG